MGTPANAYFFHFPTLVLLFSCPSLRLTAELLFGAGSGNQVGMIKADPSRTLEVGADLEGRSCHLTGGGPEAQRRPGALAKGWGWLFSLGWACPTLGCSQRLWHSAQPMEKALSCKATHQGSPSQVPAETRVQLPLCPLWSPFCPTAALVITPLWGQGFRRRDGDGEGWGGGSR